MEVGRSFLAAAAAAAVPAAVAAVAAPWWLSRGRIGIGRVSRVCWLKRRYSKLLSVTHRVKFITKCCFGWITSTWPRACSFFPYGNVPREQQNETAWPDMEKSHDAWGDPLNATGAHAWTASAPTVLRRDEREHAERKEESVDDREGKQRAQATLFPSNVSHRA